MEAEMEMDMIDSAFTDGGDCHATEVEISDFDAKVSIHHEVWRLQVAVYDGRGAVMKVTHTRRRPQRHLHANPPLQGRHAGLGVSLQHGEEASARAEFLDDGGGGPDGAEQEDDVGVAKPSHNRNLLLQFVQNLGSRRVLPLAFSLVQLRVILPGALDGRHHTLLLMLLMVIAGLCGASHASTTRTTTPTPGGGSGCGTHG